MQQRVTLQDIREAAERIRPYIRRTPILREKNMDGIVNCQMYLKPEMLQVIGAFKLRGATNKFLSLTPEEQKKGIITSSSGNHGQACAYLGQMFGVPVTVVVPHDTPSLKVNNARAMGAEVILWDLDYDARWAKIHELVAEHGYNIIHPFEDSAVMAGQGTIALEVLENLSDLDTIVVPIGGGGLISGISTFVKESGSKARVIGVQATACAAYYTSRKNGSPTEVSGGSTVADGLACHRPGNLPYPIIEKYVDDIVVVGEEEILEAVRIVADKAKLIGEPSACVGIAALMTGLIKTRPDEKVCTVLTSGNWGIEKIGRILKGETVEGITRVQDCTNNR